MEQPDISNLHSLQSITQSLKGELKYVTLTILLLPLHATNVLSFVYSKTPKIERLHAAQHAGSISDQSESDTDTELSGNECQVEVILREVALYKFAINLLLLLQIAGVLLFISCLQVINTAQMRDPSETVDLGLSNDWANNDYGKQLK